MPTIRITSFSGIMPRIHRTLLPDGCAVTAHNCRLQNGKLVPVREPSAVVGVQVRSENGLAQIADTQTLYVWHRGDTTELLAWPGIVKVARGNIADDALHRLFVTGDTGVGAGAVEPCAYLASDSDTSFTRVSLVKAALPRITPNVVADTSQVSVSETIEPDNVRYTYFFQTWFDTWGYESPPSPIVVPDDEVTYNDGNTVTIGSATVPSITAAGRRIYKVVTGAETERIQFVREQTITAGAETFEEVTFVVKDEDAGEVIPMIVAPPADLCWMSFVPGNFYAGFSAANLRNVMFSDVDRPYSWPDAYVYGVRDDIVGLAVTGNTAFVMTKGYPWAITGTAPESMAPTVLASPQGCVSARSICVYDGRAYYASADGICMLSSDALNVQVITEKYFKKTDWAALNPATCIMEAYDGALHCWFTLTDGRRQGYLMALGEGLAAVTTHSEQARAVCYDPVTDGLYFVRVG